MYSKNTAFAVRYAQDRTCNNQLIFLNPRRIIKLRSRWAPLGKIKRHRGQTVQSAVESCAYIWRRPCTLPEEPGFLQQHQTQPTPAKRQERTLGRWASPQTCGDTTTEPAEASDPSCPSCSCWVLVSTQSKENPVACCHAPSSLYNSVTHTCL